MTKEQLIIKVVEKTIKILEDEYNFKFQGNPSYVEVKIIKELL